MGINIDSLIAAASRKLGVPEEKIRAAVNSGNVSELKAYLGDKERESYERAMKERGLTEEPGNKYMAGRRR